VGGLLSVSPPEEHHERRTFLRRGGNPKTCDSVLRSIPKKAFADIFQKLYERCQQCVVKDGFDSGLDVCVQIFLVMHSCFCSIFTTKWVC
jgi:hypothetical protein